MMPGTTGGIAFSSSTPRNSNYFRALGHFSPQGSSKTSRQHSHVGMPGTLPMKKSIVFQKGKGLTKRHSDLTQLF